MGALAGHGNLRETPGEGGGGVLGLEGHTMATKLKV
jgi:hypothetical protein